jgi:hypothetical protein
MRRGSVCSVLVVGLRVVKRVCGALSGAELMIVLDLVVVVEDWNEGRVMVKVSVVGLKERVVVWEKSGIVWLVGGDFLVGDGMG